MKCQNQNRPSPFTDRMSYEANKPGFSFFMAAPCNRAGHYIFALWFLFSSSFFFSFPRLISAVRDWMSTVLRHMVWP